MRMPASCQRDVRSHTHPRTTTCGQHAVSRCHRGGAALRRPRSRGPRCGGAGRFPVRASRRNSAHVGIERRHRLGAGLDHDHRKTTVMQRFGHLQPDVTAADDDRPTGIRVRRDVVAQRRAVGDRLDSVYARGVDPGQVGARRSRTRGHDEQVERLRPIAARTAEVAPEVRARVDRDHLRVTFARRFRSLGRSAMSSPVSWKNWQRDGSLHALYDVVAASNATTSRSVARSRRVGTLRSSCGIAPNDDVLHLTTVSGCASACPASPRSAARDRRRAPGLRRTTPCSTGSTLFGSTRRVVASEVSAPLRPHAHLLVTT